MNKEIALELKHKLQHIKTAVEHLVQGKELPREMIELASKHMAEIEELLESL